MWFKLVNANFTTNLGTMSSLSNSWGITWSVSGGIVKTSCPGSVTKGGTLNATLTLNSGASLTSIASSSGTLTKTVSGTTVTVKVTGISANCTITVVATGGVAPDPIPTPPGGTDFVDPRLSHPQTKAGASVPSNGIITKDITVVLEDCWMNSDYKYLSWNPEGSGGESNTTYTDDYFYCYLPVDISGYTKIDITANNDNAAYYQFFTQDLSFKTTGGRIKIDKGTSVTAQAIPSGAKYLLLCHHRIKEGAYSDYYPTTVKLYK